MKITVYRTRSGNTWGQASHLHHGLATPEAKPLTCIMTWQHLRPSFSPASWSGNTWGQASHLHHGLAFLFRLLQPLPLLLGFLNLLSTIGLVATVSVFIFTVAWRKQIGFRTWSRDVSGSTVLYIGRWTVSKIVALWQKNWKLFPTKSKAHTMVPLSSWYSPLKSSW